MKYPDSWPTITVTETLTPARFGRLHVWGRWHLLWFWAKREPEQTSERAPALATKIDTPIDSPKDQSGGGRG